MSATSAQGVIAFGNARGRHVLLLLAACAFVAMGVFLLAVGAAAARLAGIVGIVFFGGCAAVFVRQLLDSRPRLIFDDIGVFDRTLGTGRIPWSGIRAAELFAIQGNAFIGLELRDEAHWLGRLSPLQRTMVAGNRKLGFPSLSLNLSGLAVDPSAVLALVLVRIAPYLADDEARGDGALDENASDGDAED